MTPSVYTPSSPDTLRLFFALWPEAALRERLATLMNQLLPATRPRRVPVENLHVTLAFLGVSDGPRRACAEAVAARLEGESCTLVLDHVSYRPRQQLLWLGASHVPGALLRLVADLGQGLAECGVPVEPRPFQAHMTLARRLRHRPPLTHLEPLVWPLQEFHLMVSESRPEGAVYRRLASWPLRPGAS